MEIGITYLYPYDDDGNSDDSIFLSRRQGAPAVTTTARGYTLLHMTNRRLLPFNLFPRLHLHTTVPSPPPWPCFTYGHGHVGLTF